MTTDLPTIVNRLWAASVLLQLWVCAILVIRKHFRRLPLLTAYIALNICQAVLLFFVYRYFGEPSEVGYVAGWWSEAVTVVARVFATAEVLRLALLSYRGIWGLAWRVLAGTSLAMSILAVVASRGDTDRALLNVDRGYHLIFATGIVACLLVIRYYQISVGRIYKTLLVTLCFYSCIKILINTVLQNFLSVHYMEFGVIWQVVSLFSYIAVLAIWAGALAHPLPAIEPQRAVLASSVYQRVSPEINSQLRAINGRLMSFFKIEERQP